MTPPDIIIKTLVIDNKERGGGKIKGGTVEQ